MKDGFLLADWKLEVCQERVALVAFKKVLKYTMSIMQGH